MCLGMKNLTKSTVQEVILTRHEDQSIRRSNARTMCKQSNGRSICGLDPALTDPAGNPLSIPSYLCPDLLNKWYLKTECDEFPFGESDTPKQIPMTDRTPASSCEGGDLSFGSTYCLSAWENRWGSWQMRPWSALKYGQRCKIVIDSSWNSSAQGAVPGGAPVGKAKPARLLKRAQIPNGTYGGGRPATTRL
jgi:hypothetical protein